MKSLLEDAIQPRPDYFSFTQLQPALIYTLQHLMLIGDDCWNRAAIKDLITGIENEELDLQAESGKGEKGIYGTNPIHGALYKISKISIRKIDYNFSLILSTQLFNGEKRLKH